MTSLDARPPSGVEVLERRAARALLVDDHDRLLLFLGLDPDGPERGQWWFTPGGGLRDTSYDQLTRSARRMSPWRPGASARLESILRGPARNLVEACGRFRVITGGRLPASRTMPKRIDTLGLETRCVVMARPFREAFAHASGASRSLCR